MKVMPPNRVERRFTQSLAGSPDEVFALLCPVREVEWVNGWNPKIVLSHSGLAEPDCVFTTPASPNDALWVMTGHDPEGWRLEILKVIPGVVVGKITIQLAEIDEGAQAEIAYSYTSLSEHGDAALEGFSQQHFDAFMLTWEEELNHFLRTGEKLPGA